MHRHTFTTHAVAGAAAPRNGSREISPPPSPRAHPVNGEQPEHPRGWLLMAQELKDSSPAVAQTHTHIDGKVVHHWREVPSPLLFIPFLSSILLFVRASIR